jgi:hypothetical protein
LAAVCRALETSLADTRERNELAALVTAWLVDDRPTTDPPPLSSSQLRLVSEELRRRLH